MGGSDEVKALVSGILHLTNSVFLSMNNDTL